MADLGMHGARVDRPLGDGHGVGRGFEILRGVRREFGSAAGRTEMIGGAPMGVMMRRGLRIDGHAANRIAGLTVVLVRSMIVPSMTCRIGERLDVRRHIRPVALSWIPHGGI